MTGIINNDELNQAIGMMGYFIDDMEGEVQAVINDEYFNDAMIEEATKKREEILLEARRIVGVLKSKL